MLPFERQLLALAIFWEPRMFGRKKEPERRTPWNKGKLVGQKAPFSMQEIWSIRMRLQTIGNRRDLALFNLAIDSKLRACDLLELRISDVLSGGKVLSRATVRQRKTKRPVRFEITARTRKSIEEWIEAAELGATAYLFPSRVRRSRHLSTRQYARIVNDWVSSIGLDPAAYGTHSLRRTKATLIYRRTKNLRAVQLLLGHTNLDSTVRYLGIEIDDALEMSEQIDI
jgi:integrase